MDEFDGAQLPQTKATEKLEWALQSWGGSYESEMYAARHGWMIPGREVHNLEEAERGFARLMELFDNTLRAPVTA